VATADCSSGEFVVAIMRIQGPPLRVLWSLLWRAVLFLPITATFIVLPIAAAFFVGESKWWLAGACLVVWLPAILLVRWAWRRQLSARRKDERVVV